MTLPRTTHALLLSERDSTTAVDRAMLRRLGVQRLHHCSSGMQGLAYIAAQISGTAASHGNTPVTFILCDERLTDMNSLGFLLQLRATPGIERTPLLLLAGNKETPLAQTALAAGGCAVLSRPYTQREAETAIVQALRAIVTVEQAHHIPLEQCLVANGEAITVQETQALGHTTHPQLAKQPTHKLVRKEVPAIPASAEGYFRQGFAAMRAGNMNLAENSLQTAFTQDPLHAEACLALSNLYQAQEKEDTSRMWLCRAGTACLRRHQPDKARDIFFRLPKCSGTNPLAQEASRMMEEGEMCVAAQTFLAAHKLEEKTPLHTLVARGCMFTSAPDDMLKKLCGAFAKTGHAQTARRLFQQLMPPEAPGYVAEKEAFWHRFPVICDIVSVASYTFSSWREA